MSSTTNLSSLTLNSIGTHFSPGESQAKETFIQQLSEEKSRLVKEVILGNGAALIEAVETSPLNSQKVEWLIQELNQELQDAGQVEGVTNTAVDGFEARKVDETSNWEIRIKLHPELLTKINSFVRRDKERQIKIAEREIIKALNLLKKDRIVRIGENQTLGTYITRLKEWLEFELTKEGLSFTITTPQYDTDLVDEQFTPGMINNPAERAFEIYLKAKNSKAGSQDEKSAT